MRDAQEIATIRARWARPIADNRCANCGTVAFAAKKIIAGGWICDEEFVCSDACYEALEKHGCPQERDDNYRPRPQEVLDYEHALLTATAHDIATLLTTLDVAGMRVAELEAAMREAIEDPDRVLTVAFCELAGEDKP